MNSIYYFVFNLVIVSYRRLTRECNPSMVERGERFLESRPIATSKAMKYGEISSR